MTLWVPSNLECSDSMIMQLEILLLKLYWYYFCSFDLGLILSSASSVMYKISVHAFKYISIIKY